MNIDSLKMMVEKCDKCVISKYINNKVFWEWDLKAKLMFVGEAPWKNEDLSWKPFVGAAWKILDYFIESKLNLHRSDVFITSVLKCRPPSNRNPKLEEINNCFPYLKKHIDLIDPIVIVALWKIAVWTLITKIWTLETDNIIEKIKVNKFSMKDIVWKKFILKNKKILFVTYHPAAVIYNNKLKNILETNFELLK